MAQAEETGRSEVIELGQELAETYPWVDADELDHDDEFDRLVELLTDPESIDDHTFAEVALRGAKFLRAGASAAIAAGRPAPRGWTESAESRFEHGEWGERQLLLRALARARREGDPGRARARRGGLERQPARPGGLALPRGPSRRGEP